ncbi:MAG: cyclase family protein [Candidatus Krumholzibacteriia bacterium]
MRVIDLSHPLDADTPVYPGTPRVELAPACTLEADGYLEHRLVLGTHVGTHVDAPAHLITDAASLDQLSVDRFVGRAVVLDPGGLEDGRVTVLRLEAQRDRLERMDFVLLRTGWARRWGQPGYLEGFPCLAPDAARWLADHGVRGFGVDAISVDPVGDSALAVHHELLSRGLVIVENLANLGVLPGTPFTFCALPLRIAGGDGSPVRAVALLDPPVSAA